MTAILGISAFYHDSAAALVIDGEIVAAAQEERFSRIKHDERFPLQAIEACLEQVGFSASDLDFVTFYEKPLLKFDRLLETYLAYAPAGLRSFAQAMPEWLGKKLYLPREIRRGLGPGYAKRVLFPEHHESHAASAFYPSPFDEAVILTVDGVGEWASSTLGFGSGAKITLSHEQRFPHSLGLLYSAFTYYCGFKVNSGEYKLMGLAPYGEPRYAKVIEETLIDLKDDGSFRLDLSYFNYCQGLTMTGPRFDELFGGAPRRAEAPITQREMDLAASVQLVCEEIVLRMARHAHALHGLPRLCLAGGVALNCVANGRLMREGPFEEIWVQPAAGDAGGALGAALFAWHELLGNERSAQRPDAQRGTLLGPAFGNDEVEEALQAFGAVYQRLESPAQVDAWASHALAGGMVVGWMQGRMEFGPRALGSRSILGDARLPSMQRQMNLKIKLRESFRPFAPSVLAERAGEYFEVGDGEESPYMLFVTQVAEAQRLDVGAAEQARGLAMLAVQRSRIPAVTHVDGSARLQTVGAERHPRFHSLLSAFAERTETPLLINTSFNVRGEPIVCTPADAWRCFMATEMDALVIEDCVLVKSEQAAHLAADARTEHLARFELD